MSTTSNKQSIPEFDYWEFVHCAVCFAPFLRDPHDVNSHSPTVPFWLTECGHTVCNLHLKADQSCTACGALNIQLIPLQRELSPPMSEWFKPVSHTLEAVAGTVRFQQDTMAALVRFYKRRCMQQYATLTKTREIASENKALRAQIEQLQRENIQLRQTTAHGNIIPETRFSNRNRSFSDSTSYEAGDFRNNNGKRQMVPVQGFLQNRQVTIHSLLPRFINYMDTRSSSPKTITTPRPPSRITLPPDRQPSESRNESNGNRNSLNVSNSPRFGQSAYQPPATPSRPHSARQQEFYFRPQTPMMAVPENRSNNTPQYDSRRHQQQQQRSMPPPPPPVHRRPFLPSNDPQRTTRGNFRPASTVSHGGNPLQHFSRNVDPASNINLSASSPMPATPSNRFFAQRPRTTDPELVRNVSANLASSGTRMPFVPQKI